MSAALSILLFLVTFIQHGTAQYNSQWQQNVGMVRDDRMQQLPLMNNPEDQTSYERSVFSRNNNERGRQGFTDDFRRQPRYSGTTKDTDISWKDYMQRSMNLRFCDDYVAGLGIATRIVSNSVLRSWMADLLCEKMMFDYVMPWTTKRFFGFDYAKWKPEVIYEKKT
ncbi:uncharacterized protein LOC134707601 isoform X2 [Mytilus trossulus]|uniref:uncharacterized protein LOC134707601 isoform X2 n=1 Tax=Mytilus trossulus TaxID=6551 RepID=UPI0030043748